MHMFPTRRHHLHKPWWKFPSQKNRKTPWPHCNMGWTRQASFIQLHQDSGPLQLNHTNCILILCNKTSTTISNLFKHLTTPQMKWETQHHNPSLVSMKILPKHPTFGSTSPNTRNFPEPSFFLEHGPAQPPTKTQTQTRIALYLTLQFSISPLGTTDDSPTSQESPTLE